MRQIKIIIAYKSFCSSAKGLFDNFLIFHEYLYHEVCTWTYNSRKGNNVVAVIAFSTLLSYLARYLAQPVSSPDIESLRPRYIIPRLRTPGRSPRAGITAGSSFIIPRAGERCGIRWRTRDPVRAKLQVSCTSGGHGFSRRITERRVLTVTLCQPLPLRDSQAPTVLW